MSEYLTLDLPELRRRLEAHQVERPQDLFSPEMQRWMKTKDRIAFAIELKEAEAAAPPFRITVSRHPIERPAHPLPRLHTQEVPVPRANPARHHDPETRIEQLMERLKAAIKKGGKPYWIQQDIRDCCVAHGLDIPPEAQKKRGARRDASQQQGVA
jgi:hypothetical protein